MFENEALKHICETSNIHHYQEHRLDGRCPLSLLPAAASGAIFTPIHPGPLSLSITPHPEASPFGLECLFWSDSLG